MKHYKMKNSYHVAGPTVVYHGAGQACQLSSILVETQAIVVE